MIWIGVGFRPPSWPEIFPEPKLSSTTAKLFALDFDDDEFNPDQLRLLEQLMPKASHGRYGVPEALPSFLSVGTSQADSSFDFDAVGQDWPPK